MDARLGLCSAYSLLYGIHKPSAILERADSYGVKTVSFCDINNLYGVHTFLEEAKERQIRPIIGAALTAGTHTSGAVYCFVENRKGFGRLCEILSERNKDIPQFNPLFVLRENADGLILASADNNALCELSGRVKKLYAAITPDEIRVIGKHKELPLAFLDTSVFLDKSDYAVHKVLRAIDLNKTIGSLSPNDMVNDTVSDENGLFKKTRDLRKRLNSWPEAAKGTLEIVEVCQFRDIFDGFIFPAYGTNPGEELRQRVYSGAAIRYGALNDKVIERIEYEMNIIEQKGFCPYFLRMDDIVKMAKSVNGLNRTCGRGSGAASIVSYTLGITNVDPIAHNLYFERFLNPSRPDPPDIDVDFAWDERDDLIKAVIEKTGPEYCARVANHNFFRPRSALRETAKAYGFSDGEISQLERKIELGIRIEELGIESEWQEIFHIAKRVEGLPRGLGMHCGGLVITPEPINRFVPIEKSAEGYPLMVWEKDGAEAAGFVKIDLLGNRSLAVIRDALINLKENGTPIDPYKWRPIDDEATVNALARGDSMGVFYIESPAMRQLQKKTGTGDFEHIVIHSSLIRPAANRFINEYVRRLKGGKWEPLHPRLENILNESYGILCYQEDVSKAAIALAGFNEADADKLRKVIAKKAAGAKLAVYENQFLEGCRKNHIPEETIKKVWEMMLSFDGYSFCKPHSASYAMVSFQSAYLRVHHPAEFMAAVISNQGGYYRAGAYISECRRMGLLLEGPDINSSRWKYYAENPHQEGNLRHPVARLSIPCGFSAWTNTAFSSAKAVETAAYAPSGRLPIGMDFTPPFGGLAASMPPKATQINNDRKLFRGTVVIGLMAIKGLSASGAERIIAEREAGPYKSLEDFSQRVRPCRDDIIALCPSGVFDSIADNIPRPIQARKLLAAANGIRNEELFAKETVSGCLIANEKNKIISNSSLLPHHLLWEEYRSLGFLRRIHPLALWKEKIIPLKRVKARHIAEYLGQNVQMLGWPVTKKEVWTKDNLSMSFLTLEDETDIYETVIFPQVYQQYGKLLFDQIPLLVRGKVCNDHGAIVVEVKKISDLTTD